MPEHLDIAERMNDAADILDASGAPITNAVYDFPGCIYLTLADGRCLVVGLTNDTLQADVLASIAAAENGDQPIAHLELGIPCEDIGRINAPTLAEVVLAHVNAFVAITR